MRNTIKICLLEFSDFLLEFSNFLGVLWNFENSKEIWKLQQKISKLQQTKMANLLACIWWKLPYFLKTFTFLCWSFQILLEFSDCVGVFKFSQNSKEIWKLQQNLKTHITLDFSRLIIKFLPENSCYLNVSKQTSTAEKSQKCWSFRLKTLTSSKNVGVFKFPLEFLFLKTPKLEHKCNFSNVPYVM